MATRLDRSQPRSASAGGQPVRVPARCRTGGDGGTAGTILGSFGLKSVPTMVFASRRPPDVGW